MEYKSAQTNHVKKVITLLFIMLLTLGILFMTSGAFAQSMFYIGPTIGMGTQQSYNSNFYKDPGVKVNSMPGENFGISLQDSMNTNISMGVGLSYSSFGTQAKYTDKTAEDGILYGTYYDSYGYLTAPLSIMFKSTRTVGKNTLGFFGQLELIPSINTNASQKQTLNGSPLTLDTITSEVMNVKGQTRVINLMVGVTGGIILSMNKTTVLIGPYYTTSLTDIKRPPYPYYTTVGGASEPYTPTVMKSIGLNVTVAMKIKTKASKKMTAATTNVAH